MLFFISGTDHFRCQQKLKELINQFVQKRDQSGFNIIKLDGESLEADRFEQEVLTVPFLSEKKLIVIKNILKNKKRWGSIFEFLRSHEERLENNLAFIELIDPEKKTKPSGPFFEYLKKQKYYWQFNLMNDNQLRVWLKNHLNGQKIKMEERAIDELIMLVGNDLYQLTSEIKKLTAFKNGEIIKEGEVKKLVKAKFDENIFNLVDAIGTKNRKRALKLAADQLNSNNHPLSILTMIGWQFKTLIKVKEKLSLNRRVNNQQLANELGLHPFAVQKASWQVKNFTNERLVSAQVALLEIESQLKSGAKNPELLFDLFIMKYC